MNLFSQRIKEERKRLKLTQDQVADQSGISRNTYHSWEIGRRIPDMNSYTLSILAKFFRVSPLYLLGKTDFRNKWDQYDKDHADEIQKLKLEVGFISSAEALGVYIPDPEDPEQSYRDFIAYNQRYQERKVMMKTRSDIKVVTGAKENQIIYSFVTDEITIQVKTEADVETGFQKLIERGIISE